MGALVASAAAAVVFRADTTVERAGRHSDDSFSSVIFLRLLVVLASRGQ
jgi:hypothetical protein